MKILLLGKDGGVGWELQRALAPLGQVLAYGRESVNVACQSTLRSLVRSTDADVVVNATGYTDVDRAEFEPDLAHAINAVAPRVLSEEVGARGGLLIHYSSDYVFDGTGQKPWDELAQAVPINEYGRSKLDGERSIQDSGCAHLILRSSWLYGVRGENFIKTILGAAEDREELSIVDDQFGAPTASALLADVTAHAVRATLADPSLTGLYHIAASGWTSWFEYGRHVIARAHELGYSFQGKVNRVLAVSSDAYGSQANRPKNSRLSTSKVRETFGLELPPWTEGVDRFIVEWLCDRSFVAKPETSR